VALGGAQAAVSPSSAQALAVFFAVSRQARWAARTSASAASDHLVAAVAPLFALLVEPLAEGHQGLLVAGGGAGGAGRDAISSAQAGLEAARTGAAAAWARVERLRASCAALMVLPDQKGAAAPPGAEGGVVRRRPRPPSARLKGPDTAGDVGRSGRGSSWSGRVRGRSSTACASAAPLERSELSPDGFQGDVRHLPSPARARSLAFLVSQRSSTTPGDAAAVQVAEGREQRRVTAARQQGSGQGACAGAWRPPG
jgi:hypothetical protein